VKPSSSHSEAGTATLELAILAPALLVLLGLVIVAGRVVAAGSAVEHAAAAAARSASLSRDAREAQTRAQAVAQESLADQGIDCVSLISRIDTGGFAVALGNPSSVTVDLECAVALGDVAVPGMPGLRRISARSTSPLDSYRGRG
jgi:Flp pilus assembly protein TadG